MSKSHMLSQPAKTLIREVSLMEPMRRSLTHMATLVNGTTQRSTILFVGNSILTNSKQKKCVASVVVVILKKVFPLLQNISEKTLLQVSTFQKISATLATRLLLFSLSQPSFPTLPTSHRNVVADTNAGVWSRCFRARFYIDGR